MADDTLKTLFESYTGQQLTERTELPTSGSHRRYFRLKGGNISIVGVIGTSLEENRAFVAISKHFKEKGLNVPTVLAVSEDGMSYIQEDLGEKMLFDLIAQGRDSGFYNSYESNLLCRTIEQLPKIQFKGAEGLDWNVCYPQKEFDARMVDFDLNYFKYCFLKATGLEFNEGRLQDDFERLKAELLKDSDNTFLYRDFQARNVIIRDGEPYFIDYQGGRRGPIYYDVASFIWQARARYPDELKEELIRTYLRSLRSFLPVDEDHFRERLRLFVLFRTLQVLGAYGFRGYFEKKPHFLASVPFALDNLRSLLRIPFSDYPYLNSILTELTNMPQFYEIAVDKRLEVHIYSFAYKKGIPADNTGNGGGYVFDCRSVNNPGKYEHYRQFNGNDPEVIKFLEDDGEVLVFLESVYKLVDAHVQRFIERKFTHLQVCFGCTGGQHRSVFCAERLAAHLAGRYNVKVKLTHRELNIEKVL
ncbi:MAG: phosphotransferase [Bacteroidales bacterium]|nr:phosphotransferase [Bacteroidales bacterium]MBQ1656516.1 phosphotransferase [Bacteroidales bacterium]MBQ2229732.1 phosphotransferase [Bacteroidales bacterium]MBQ2544096.1 phosphotransferase [Bacteroidales bacterium]MBQ3941736.1 phosphotransferase [Bacteroidales bacterium]